MTGELMLSKRQWYWPHRRGFSGRCTQRSACR